MRITKRGACIASALFIIGTSTVAAGAMVSSGTIAFKPSQAAVPATPDTSVTSEPDSARVVWHFVEPGKIGNVQQYSDYSDLTTSFVYEPLTTNADGTVQWRGNRFPDIVNVSTEPMRWRVMTDYASTDAYGGPAPKEVTSQAKYDPKTGIITMPEEFAGEDLTLIWYVEGTEGDKLVPYETVVTRNADGRNESVTLTSQRRADSKVVGVHVSDVEAQVTGTAEGVTLSDFTCIDGNVNALASAMGPSLHVSVTEKPALMAFSSSDEASSNIHMSEMEEIGGTSERQSRSLDNGDMSAFATNFNPTIGYRYSFGYVDVDSQNSDSDKNTAAILGYPEKNKKYGFLTHFKFPFSNGPDLTEADYYHTAPGGYIDTASGGHYDYRWAAGTHWIWGECAGDVDNNGAGLAVIDSGWVQITGIDYSTGICTWDYSLSVHSGDTGAKQQTIVGSFRTKEDLNGWVQIVKKSEADSLTSGNPQYTLANARYGIYRDANCTDMVETVSTNASGKVTSGDLPSNVTYYVKELTPPKGFKRDGKVYPVAIKSGETITLPVDGEDGEGEDLQVGAFTITKRSTDERTTSSDADDYYSFDGIQYTLASTEKVAGTSTPRYVYTMTLDKYGAVKSVTLNANGSTLPYSGNKAPYIEKIAYNQATVHNIVCGDYTLTETKDNAYYYLDPTPVGNISFESTTTGADPADKSTVRYDEPRYASYVLMKVTNDANADLGDYYDFKNCEYTLVGKNSGEVYTMVTCEGGYAQHGLPANYRNCRYDCFAHYGGHHHNAYEGRVLKSGERVYGDILYDDYVVTETKSNKYWKKNPTSWTVSLTSASTQASLIPKEEDTEETPNYMQVEINKKSTEPDKTDGRDPYYNFEGIKYKLKSRNTHVGGGEKEDGHLVYYVTLDKEGHGVSPQMVFDTYDLTEAETNAYFAKKNGIVGSYRLDAANTSSGTQRYLITPEDEPNKGTIKVIKSSKDGRTPDNPYYTYEGIVYLATSHGIYEDGKHLTYELPLDENGVGQADNVVFDTYDITEIQTNKWYARDYTVYDSVAVVTAEKTDSGKIPVTFSASDQPNYIYFDVQKSSNYPTLSFDNDAYSLAGAEFEVRNTRTGEVADTIVTRADGYGISKPLPYDDYKVVETKACLNHVIMEVHEWSYPHQTLTMGKRHSVGSTGAKVVPNEPGCVIAGELVKKVDAESEKGDSPGESTLAGAVFEISYYATNDVKVASDANAKPKRKWYMKTDENGKTDFQSVTPGDMTVTTKQDGQVVTRTFTSDEVYYRHDGTEKVIPCGVFTVREVLNPEGYIYDNATHQGPGKLFTYHVTADPTQTDPIISCVPYETVTDEPPVRGDVEFVKLDEVTGLPMSGIPFLVTAKATGESHVVTTGADGVFKVRERHQANPGKDNANDKLLATNDSGEHVLTNENALDHDAGIFFVGYGEKNDPDGSKAANAKPEEDAFPMPYGTYVIEELPCLKNYERTLETVEVTVTQHDKRHVIGSVVDREIAISTTATDQLTGEHIGSSTADTATISDEVTYTNLTPGREYTMSGTLMDKSTGNPIKGAAGADVTVTQTFVPTVADSSVTLTFTVPMEAVKGKAVVVYEKLRDAQREIARHEDIDDEGQTVRYADIRTNATDVTSGNHEGVALSDDIEIVDTVTYENLLAGEEYTMKATLMDKATGKPISDAHGEPVTAERTFVADGANGSVEIKIGVKRELVAGKTTVAFEELMLRGTVVATHEDIDDEDQTVEYPKIHTNATDELTGLHEGLVRDNVVIDDVVTFENLIKGQRYEVRGTLMDRETGDALTDANGKSYESRVVFVADEGKGYVLSESVTVKDDGSDTDSDENKNEGVSEEGDNADTGNDNANGGDPANGSENGTDKGDVPEGEDKGENGNESVELAPEPAPDEDIPALEPIPGRDGKRVSGTVSVKFEVPGALLAGKTTVVFEDLHADLNQTGDLTLDEDGQIREEDKEIPEPTEIYKHEDLEDDAQTVWFPKIGTTATVNGVHVSQFVDEVELTDIVAYENLEPGQTYLVRGTVMEKNSGEVLRTSDGAPVISETQFVPETEDGELSVDFSFAGTGMDSAATVVFEEIYKIVSESAGGTPDDDGVAGGAGDNETDTGASEPDSEKPAEMVLVAEHSDLDDEGQSVYFAAYADTNKHKDEEILPEAIPQAIVAAAGDIAKIALPIMVAAAIAAGTVMGMRRRKR